MKKRSIEEKLVTKIDIGRPDECWPWTGSVNNQGYGMVAVPRGGGLKPTARCAHRVVYKHVFGDIPNELVVDHLCHTRDSSCNDNKNCPHKLCCNPAHLEAVTQVENVMRGNLTYEHSGGWCLKKLHKINGPADWIVQTNGRRNCRLCFKAAAKARRSR